MAFDLDAYAEGRPQPRRRNTYLDQWDEARANTEDPGTLGGVWNNVKKGYYGAMRAGAFKDAKDEQERPFRPIAPDESFDAAEAEAQRRYEQSGSAADEAQLQRLSRRSYSANNPAFEQISRDTSAANKKAFVARKAGEVEQYTRKIQSLPNAEAYQRWERATGGDAWGAFLSDPFEVTSNIVAGSASQMATQMAIGAAAGFAGGSVGGQAGAMVGSALGAGLSSFSGEYASSFLDSMEEAGVDMSDRDSIIKGLSDPEAISRAKSYALKRAVPVGVFDMLSLGIAGKLVGKPGVAAVEKGIMGFARRAGSKAGELAAEATIQGGLGAAGEATAQLVSRGKVDDWKSVAGEFIGEFGGAPGEVAVGAVTKAYGAAKAAMSPQVNISANLAAAAEEAATAGSAPVEETPELAAARRRLEAESRLRADAGEDDFGMGGAAPAYSRKRKPKNAPPAPDPTVSPTGEAPFDDLKVFNIDGKLSTFVEHRQVAEVASGVEFVRSMDDAAHVVSGLRKYPQENIVLLITDQNGRPIQIARHQVGGPTSAGFNPGILIGTAASTPGASEVWFIHNHPSGKASLSPADISASGAVQRLTEAAGLKYRGAMAIAFNKYAIMDEGGSILSNQSIPALPRKYMIPMTERMYRNVGYLGQTAFADPAVVSQEMPALLGGRPGIVFANNANMPVAALPLTEEVMKQMIQPGGANQYFAALERSNAVNAFLYTADIDPAERVKVIENISRLANASKITLLDAIDAAGVTHSRHIIGYDSAFRSRGEGQASASRPAGPEAEELVQAIRDSFGKATDKLLELGRIRVVSSVDQLTGLHPDDTRGVALSDGSVEIAAQNVGKEEARGMVLHEVGVHVGLEAMVGPELFQHALSEVDRLIAEGNEHAVAARDAVPSDTPDAMRREEQLGYLMENAPELGFIRKIIAAIRAWVYRSIPGGRMMSLSVGDLQALATAAVRQEANRMASDETAQAAPRPSRKGFRVVQAPDGGYNWGEVAEADAKQVGLDPGRIMLKDGFHYGDHRGFGLEHIEAQHGEEIRSLGMEPTEFVYDVLQNYNNIALQDGGRIALISNTRPTRVVVLDPLDSGGYSVRTAFYDNSGNLFRRISEKGQVYRRRSGPPPPPSGGGQPVRPVRPSGPPPGPPPGAPTPKGYSRSGGAYARWDRRPSGWLTIFRSKRWWGLLLSEAKRNKRMVRACADSLYVQRMRGAGWQGVSLTPWTAAGGHCGVCSRGSSRLKCQNCGAIGHKGCWDGVDIGALTGVLLWCPRCLQAEEGRHGIGPPVTMCSLCKTSLPGGGSAWHVIGRCLHPDLQAERGRIWQKLGGYISEQATTGHPRWQEAWKYISAIMVVDEEGRWRTPPGWDKGDPSLDGRAANPWYGLFPWEWLPAFYETACPPAQWANGSLRTMERAKRALRALGDMCVFACGEMWRTACGLWCRTEGEARMVAAHQPHSQLGPTRLMRLAAIADLQDSHSRQNALATATQARNEWIAAGRPKGRGSANWDDTQWLIKGRFISATLRRARARAGHGSGRQDGSLDSWLVGRGCGGPTKAALPAMVDGRAEAGVDVDAPIYSGPTIDVERAVFDSDNTVAVADEEAEESRGGAGGHDELAGPKKRNYSPFWIGQLGKSAQKNGGKIFGQNFENFI